MRDFDAFVDEHYDTVRRGVALAVGDLDRGTELTQEAFARALTRWSSVSAMERPVAWVYVVAMNQARRDFRRDERQRSVPATPAVDAGDVAGTVTTSVAIDAALATLTPRQRAVVVLRHLADLSTAEVADALRCAPGTVKATLHQALRILRVEMEEPDEG